MNDEPPAMNDARRIDPPPHPPVVVVPYDPAWPSTFTMLSERVAPALAARVVAIEHVGSTAVPGLAAKPVIDLDVVIRPETSLSEVVERLATLGYVHLGDLGIAGREAFRAPPDLPRHHLYVCAAGSPALQAHLTLRDALRADPARAAAYGALKYELAERFGNDVDSYVEGKTPFITSVLLDVRERTRRALRK